MAQPAYLKLKINGEDIEGDSPVASLGRQDSIECLSFGSSVEVPVGDRDGRPGKRQHGPVNFVKRIDRSTPLLLKALVRNERVDEAEFRFFRPDTETGEEVHFYTVRLENGKITGVEQSSEDSTLVGDDAPPMLEEVAIVFHTITWTYEPTGATHTDSLTA